MVFWNTNSLNSREWEDWEGRRSLNESLPVKQQWGSSSSPRGENSLLHLHGEVIRTPRASGVTIPNSPSGWEKISKFIFRLDNRKSRANPQDDFRIRAKSRCKISHGRNKNDSSSLLEAHTEYIFMPIIQIFKIFFLMMIIFP